MDGFCKESSRWVSLLVAEVYYPKAKLATVRPPNSGRQPLNRLAMPNSLSPMSSHASQLSNVLAHPTSGAFHTFAQPNSHQSALDSGLNLATLSSYGSASNPLKYASFPSLTSFPAGKPTFSEYNHYDTMFNRRTSGPIGTSSSGGYPQKQSKLVSATNKPIASFLSSPGSNAHLSSNVLSGYSPQQLQHLWQQYQQALGLTQSAATPQKSNFRSDSASTLSSMLGPLLSGTSNSFASRLFGSGGGSNNNNHQLHHPQHHHMAVATGRSHEVRPRSFDGGSSRLSTLDQTMSGGATYADDEENTTPSPQLGSADVRNALVNSSPKVATASTSTAAGVAHSQFNLSQSDSSQSGSSAASTNGGSGDEEECDGYDANGCYVIRVYYDWFLVPGSCKCWKRTSSGSFDTLKRIFIGK